MKVIRKRKKLKLNEGEKVIQGQLADAKVQFSFEPHSFKFNVPATYTPDFKFTSKSGKEIYVEVKGYHAGMQAWASKIGHFIWQCPDVDYRIVFLDAKKKFNKRYKSNFGEWATKKGIKWADKGVIPKEWIEE